MNMATRTLGLGTSLTPECSTPRGIHSSELDQPFFTYMKCPLSTDLEDGLYLASRDRRSGAD